MQRAIKGKGFGGAVLIAVLVAGFMLLLTAVLLTGYFGFGGGGAMLTGVILFFAFAYLAVAVGVILALYRRWKEIQGGEEDEAKQY